MSIVPGWRLESTAGYWLPDAARNLTWDVLRLKLSKDALPVYCLTRKCEHVTEGEHWYSLCPHDYETVTAASSQLRNGNIVCLGIQLTSSTSM